LETYEKTSGMMATPFVKWAGGKSQLLRTFDRYGPRDFGTYFEPFVGGGAFFFHLVASGKIKGATISDLNQDLIDCYLAIRDELDTLLLKLKELQRYARDERYYYDVARKQFNEIKLKKENEKVQKSALLLYLNKTCYNGLYRVNRKGEFNVPWGDYKNPRIFDESNLRTISKVLNQPNIEVFWRNFEAIRRQARENDFVYFDPPYVPLSKTANFTSYTAQHFGWTEQEKLAELFHHLSAKGCYLMLSNSPGVRSLYEEHGYIIRTVKAGRAISSIGSRRGPIDELLITNYNTPQ
jgi:DNA adenine methylase